MPKHQRPTRDETRKPSGTENATATCEQPSRVSDLPQRNDAGDGRDRLPDENVGGATNNPDYFCFDGEIKCGR